MGKRYKYIYIAVLLFLVCSCRLTHKLENTGYRPQVNQPGKVTTSATKDVAEKSVVSDAAGNTDEQVRTRDEKTGEDIVTVTLSEVTVVARTKTVPERFGMVNLDFIVTVPKTLIDKKMDDYFNAYFREIRREDKIRGCGNKWGDIPSLPGEGRSDVFLPGRSL